jgi:F420-dependent oxidoreductase-like protein
MQLRVFTEPQQGGTYDTLLRWAKATEDLGFDAFFRSDHYMHFGAGDGTPGPTDAWTTLAGLARETSRIRLGTLVSPVTFRLPGPLAIIVAQVDAMSGGRVDMGIGTGWNPTEHSAYGIPFGSSFGERFEMLVEQLEIITGLWATPVGDRYSFEGKHYMLTDSPALPKPVQAPHPPIVMGGFGPKRTPRLAAKYADEFNVPFAPLNIVGERVRAVRQACERIGRDPSTMVFSSAQVVCVGRDETEFHRRAAAIGHQPENLLTGGVGGTPDQALAFLGRMAELGITRAYLQFLDFDDVEHLELVASEVLPHA